MHISNGKKFKQAMKEEKPLQLAGTLNAFSALMAKEVGFKAIYLSGAGIANISYGVPDIGMTTLENVLEEAGRILKAVDLPLIVDLDTGFDENLKKAVDLLSCLKSAGIHIEDQVPQKKCGHLENKKLVSTKEMCLKIKEAVNARQDPDFLIIARTDALSIEGEKQTLERAKSYKEAGADILFLEAAKSLEQYSLFKKNLDMPILANLTEFGKTPIFSLEELKNAGVDIALYPLSASRAMQKAAFNVYQDIRKNGSQKKSLPHMQTREELYKLLNYSDYNG
ncbi:MAG TPA: methylisocitrate lyase [Parachlamydiaceae bacterium]|nr:methylisocitrate lyase [Parachlamydiaceae bacterium]